MTTTKIEDCVSSLMTISREDGTLQQKLGHAESRICGLLLDVGAGVGGWSEVLRDLLDRLGSEKKVQNGSAREFLDKVVSLVHRRLERVSANNEESSHRLIAGATY